MKFLHTENNFRTVIGLQAALLLLFLLAGSPLVIWASGAGSGKSSIRKLSIHKSENFDSVISQKKFRIELYGGFTLLNPSDLNLLVDYDNRIQAFNYDSLLTYLQDSDQIRSWTKTQEGGRQKIKTAFPFGVRLKFYLNPMIAVSFGIKYLSKKRMSEFGFSYARNELSGEQYIENTIYSPYSLSAKAYAPILGIHITKKVNDSLTVEGFLSGGPLYVQCHYLSDWSYEWWISGTNYNWSMFTSAGVLEERGKGTGIALELGGKGSYPLAEDLEVFLEGVYSYQVAKNVSGEGRETWGESSETWDGQWGIKEEKVSSPWGELEVKLPTNYWPNNSNTGKSRDFELDLSGFQLRLGLSFRF
jgi:hypothetical protein